MAEGDTEMVIGSAEEEEEGSEEQEEAGGDDDDSDEGEEDDEMDDSEDEPEPPPKLELPSRATRGMRMGKVFLDPMYRRGSVWMAVAGAGAPLTTVR